MTEKKEPTDIEMASHAIVDEAKGVSEYNYYMHLTNDDALKGLFKAARDQEKVHLKNLTAWLNTHTDKMK